MPVAGADQTFRKFPRYAPIRKSVERPRREFTENGHDFAVAFETRVVTNEPALSLRLALADVGLALAREDVVRAYIERGELVSVLEEFSTPFPRFYLYYAARGQASWALRALIDYLLQMRQSQPPAP